MFFRRGIKTFALISMLAASLLAGFAIGYFSNPGIIMPQEPSAPQKLAATPAPDPGHEANLPFEAVTREDTILIFTTENVATGETSSEERLPTADEIGLTEAGLAALLPEWHIQNFSVREVNLVRKIYAQRETFYVLRAEDGVIAVYRRDVEGDYTEETLLQKTDIRVDMLPRTVQMTLNEGIIKGSLEEVEQLMEGWDS